MAYCPAWGTLWMGGGKEVAESFWIWRRKCKCLWAQVPRELPRLHLPQGWGVPSSSIHHPSPSSRSLSRRPSTTFLTYFCAQHQNAAPCRKSTWIAYSSFPSTSLSSTFCLRSTSSAHVDLVWLSLTLLLFIRQSSALLDSAPEYQESYPNPPALPVCLGSWGCMSTHTRIMALRDPV